MKQFIEHCKSTSRLVLSLFAMLIFMLVFGCKQGPPENSRPAQAQRGKAHFVQYCAPCHGQDAKGIAMDTLNQRPADLTKINYNRRTRDFPILEIARIIGGRNMTIAHGTRAMPVWGEVFSTEEHLSEKEIKGKMGEIIAYLMSIQE